MRKKIFVSEIGSKRKALEMCKELVLDDMKNASRVLIESWDGRPCSVTPEEHFNNIVQWCRDNIKSTIWSCQSSAKSCYTSYGFKHKCERKLKCYVANNWMKMAMICAGLEVRHCNCVDYETGYVEKQPIILSDIITNAENFIVRVPRHKLEIDNMISDWTYELKYSYGGYNDD